LKASAFDLTVRTIPYRGKSVDIDLKQISDLLAVVGGTDITELTIESGDQKITVKKSGPVYATPAAMMLADALPPNAVSRGSVPAAATMSFEPKNEVKSEAKPEAAAPAAADLVSVTSPMVGTFYRSSSPTAKPFVDVGDKISVGQTVCIIEAMKLMNDMPSEVSGKIVKVCCDNGSTVEYGQQLFLVDPKG
jgi:acetyl-CoA carboxylase biotin carboxyl carrier protein